MTSLVLLILALVCAAIYFFSNHRRKPINRYRRHKTIVSESRDTLKQNEEIERDDALYAAKYEEKKYQSTEINSQKKPSQFKSDCVIVLHLMAPKGEAYTGYELLQALLSAGLRFGKHHIFHRHEHKDGRGDILFHCASAVLPGTFDLTKMGTCSSPGLSLFFSAASVSDPIGTFDCLLETLDQLIEDLGGTVMDDQRALLTKEKMIQYRQQIRAYETSKTTADLFGFV